MDASPVEVWLWLLLVMNPHNPKTLRLLERYSSAAELCRAIRDGRCDNLTDAEKQRAANTRTREVRQIMEECAANSIRIITFDDPEYPLLLRHIYSPPVVLFARGDLGCLSAEVPLAVVGPRKPSDSAVNAARMLCGDLVKIGTLIISGLAVGIDTIAHSSAVSRGAPTVGVLACGQLTNYPAESEGLKRQILDNGGLILSELLPRAGVVGGYFRSRNRIISGLGLGTLVIEASTRSGCLLTANHAVEQGRDLFCVPPYDITREGCAGVIPYLRDGATPVYDYLDIVRAYMPQFFGKSYAGESDEELRGKRTSSQKDKPGEKAAQVPKEPKAPSEGERSGKAAVSMKGLNEIQQKLAGLIAERPQSADELIEQTGISYSSAAEALTELEIMGIVRLLPEGKYCIAGE